MKPILDYNNWQKIFENTGQAAVKLKELESNLISLLKTRGTSPEELKQRLSSFKTVEFSEELLELKESSISSNLEYTIDLVLDIVSGILEGLPIVGTAVSATIDILHTVSYAIRYFFASDPTEKIKHLIMTALGSAAAFMPLAGNLLNISALKTISKLLSVAPSKILRLTHKLAGKKLPPFHWSHFAKWKINFTWVLLKLLGNVGEDILIKISETISNLVKQIVPGLKKWASGSPVFGWIAIDYLMPALNKINFHFNELSKITGLEEFREA